MCGIAGFFSVNRTENELKKMTKSLNHRGPDANGIFIDNNFGLGLGHTRLSIIDLTSNANQPLISHSKRYVMVYNGEVYNYREIRQELKNINWKSNSDSEVILEAFEMWGINFIKKLNGMFAIAIYDKQDNKLFLFRDRMGIKPLYYFQDGVQFIFASEIKAIKECNVKLELSYPSIHSYLHLGYVPSENTIYKNVKKLKSGSFLELKNQNISIKKYWEPKIYTSKIKDFRLAKEQLNLLLVKSVKSRLISDVPIGTFISGGTDSSLITALAQNCCNSPVNTFSIGFEESKYNESEHAKKVASFLNTNHTEFILTERDAIDEIENIIEHFDEPFCDSSALPTMLVSKMAKKHVSVCLTGDGGDELFMGYGAYNWAKRINYPLVKLFRKTISKTLELSSNNRNKRAANIFNFPSKNWKSHIFSQEQNLFSESEISNVINKEPNLSLIDSINNSTLEFSGLNFKEQQAFFDLNNYLIDDLLVKVDRTSMYSSLEARVPLLDHNIVDFALNISPTLKSKQNIQKYILKEILYDNVPKEIMDRPKWGFSIPLENWLKGELSYLVEDYLGEKKIKETNILSYPYVKYLIEKFKNGEAYLYNRLWNLIVLQKFLIKSL